MYCTPLPGGWYSSKGPGPSRMTTYTYMHVQCMYDQCSICHNNSRNVGVMFFFGGGDLNNMTDADLERIIREGGRDAQKAQQLLAHRKLTAGILGSSAPESSKKHVGRRLGDALAFAAEHGDASGEEHKHGGLKSRKSRSSRKSGKSGKSKSKSKSRSKSSRRRRSTHHRR